MALIVGGTAVTGTQTLDATKLTGNLPALDGGSLTNVGLAAANFVAGSQLMGANVSKNITAPNPGVAFGVGGANQNFASCSNGTTMDIGNVGNNSGSYSHWVTIAG
tara:strand:+ start:319 stop:636 length:318 start_codon:yes stop_codon:yes gene_type:complete